MKPSKGRIVLFVLQGGVTRPAIVTDVLDESSGLVELEAFHGSLPGKASHRKSKFYDLAAEQAKAKAEIEKLKGGDLEKAIAEGRVPSIPTAAPVGTWSWPPKV